MKQQKAIARITRAPGAFVSGVLAPFRALITSKKIPGMKRYFIIPFFLNIILLSGTAFLAWYYIGDALLGLLPAGDAWYLSALRWIISPILAVLLFIGAIFVYSITGSILTAPFNDFISAKAERHLLSVEYKKEVSESGFSFGDFFDDIVRVLRNTVKLLGLLLLFNLLILFLNLVPVVGGVAYSALSFASAMFFLGFQFFDFPLERRHLEFRNKLSVVWSHKFAALGLGLGFFLITFVPIIGFLGLNLAAVGAVELFLKRILPGLDAH